MSDRTQQPNEATGYEERLPWWRVMLENHLRARSLVEILLGGVVPLTIFYGFHQAGEELTGAVLAGSWGLVVAVVTYLVTRNINVFAVFAVILTVIEVVGTLLTRSPAFYLAGAAINNFAFAVIFFGSLLFARSLIQVIVEATPIGAEAPEWFRRQPPYAWAWRNLTVLWGAASLAEGVLLVAGQLLLPLETFLVLRGVLGFPTFAVLLAFSYWYPNWYWDRQPDSAWIDLRHEYEDEQERSENKTNEKE